MRTSLRHIRRRVISHPTHAYFLARHGTAVKKIVSQQRGTLTSPLYPNRPYYLTSNSAPVDGLQRKLSAFHGDKESKTRAPSRRKGSCMRGQLHGHQVRLSSAAMAVVREQALKRCTPPLTLTPS